MNHNSQENFTLFRGFFKMNFVKFIPFLIRQAKQSLSEQYSLFRLAEKYPTCHFEREVQIKSAERLTLGKNVLIQKNTIFHCGGMGWTNHGGYIEIGDDSCISPHCIFYGTGGIKIGKGFDCGPGVMIFSSRTDYNSEQRGKNIRHLFKEVIIGDNVTLFANVVVDIGVQIGNGAVVGAGSVVLSDIPAGEIWAGAPARMIRKIEGNNK